MGHADRLRFALVAAALAVVASVSAHQNTAVQPDAEFAALLTAAKQLVNDRAWDRATAGYQALVAAARANGAVVWEGRGSLGLAEIAHATARYDDARKYALEALAMFEPLDATNDIGAASAMLAAIADAQGDERTAAPYFERAARAYRAAGNERARIEASFGLLAVTASDSPSLDGYGELQVQAQAIGDKSLEGRILHGWGDLLSQRSLYEPAVEKLEAAAALFQEIKSLAHLGTTYNSLGRLYRQHGQPAAALEFQRKALSIHETINTPREMIQSLNAVAVALQVSGDNGQARVYYERALAAAERTGVESYINFMRANLGGFLIETDTDVDRGRDLLERAVAAGASPASLRQTQLSEAYLKLGRRQDALAAAGRALTSCRTPTDCVYARVRNGRAQLALGNEAAALADLNEILAAIEKMHSTLAASDFLKQNFRRLWEDAYSIAIDLHFRRGEFRQALEAAELARSRAFIDLLASRELERSTGVSGDKPSGLSSSPSIGLSSKVSAAPTTVEGLTAIAARLRSTVLAYWVSANTVFVWALSPDGTLRGARANVSRAKLVELVQSTEPFTRGGETRPADRVIATRGDQQIVVSARKQEAWRALYDLLIAPVEAGLPRESGARLTIVPDGPLLSVPFAALRDARGRYLVERYTIHSAPAGAVLQLTSKGLRSEGHPGSVLLVGDPAAPPRIPGESPLPRLAGANDEVRAIARLLPASRTTVLAGRDATEPRVRSALAGKAIIHLATHGIVRDANPLTSFLALGTVGDGSADGQLTADEIYGLDLDAALVVLSACRSGGGVVTGDGIAGLARAFFYAGTPSVIVSVWDVADQPTNRLLPLFYRRWLNGGDKATALRAAQLSLIRSLRAGEVTVTLPAGTFVLPEDPAFWAAFVLLGNPD